MKAIISKEDYEYLKSRQENNSWCGFQSELKSRLGEVKIFKVKDSDVEFKARCSQKGGTFTGNCTYTIEEKII